VNQCLNHAEQMCTLSVWNPIVSVRGSWWS